MKTLLIAALLALLAGTVKADSIWYYAGNSTSDPDVGTFTPTQFIPTPNPCNCALVGSLTLDAGNNPIAWSFTEGAYTLNNTDSTIGLGINTTLFGLDVPLFSRWGMVVTGAEFNFISIYDGSNYEATDYGPSLYVQGNKGTWTDPMSTPEPSTLALLVAGVSALALRRKKRVDASVWFAYELAFAIICRDRTSETIQAVLTSFQQTNVLKSSYRVPAEVPIAGKKGAAKSQVAPLPIKGFQGGSVGLAH
jgi:hypothetical protein